MDIYKQALAGGPGGRVLDVATGRGGFIEVLLAALDSFESITGIDHGSGALAANQQPAPDSPFSHPAVHFLAMDAACLDFPDTSFDTVCISNSLHHLAEPQQVLHEMLRVLRPGGRLLLSEMYADGQTPAQQTHVDMHHWWGRVDSALGVLHNPTYPRTELLAQVQALELEDLQVYDVADLDGDPYDPELAAELEGVLDRYLARAKNLPQLPELHTEAERLRRRLHEVGLQWATRLLAVGRKPQQGGQPC